MFTVEAVPGLSIVIRSRDPNFSPNDMVFVTEYAGLDRLTSIPLNLSILKETDASGPFFRVLIHELHPRPEPEPGLNAGYLSPSTFPGAAVPHAQHAYPDGCHSQLLDFSDFGGLSSISDPLLSNVPSISYNEVHGATSPVNTHHEQLHSDLSLDSSGYPHAPFLSDIGPVGAGELDAHTSLHSTVTAAVATPSTNHPSMPTDDTNVPSEDTPPNSKRIYACRHEGCGKRFARQYHRQVHENSHKPKVRLPLVCQHPDCKARFGRPHDRMRHEVAKHGLKPDFICNECGKFFGTESKLSGHKCDSLPMQRHRWTEQTSKDS